MNLSAVQKIDLAFASLRQKNKMATLPKTQRKVRSGGPKTGEGKLVSSRNAIKTGAYAVQTLLPGESEEEFRELEQLFIDDFAPVGISEAALVHSLTVIIWKKLRLEKLESRHIHDLLNRFPKYIEFDAVGFNDYPSAAKEWVNNPELISSIDLELAQGGYWSLKALKKCRFDLEEMESFQKDAPGIFRRLQDLLGSLGVKDLSIPGMVGTRYNYGAESRPIEDMADKLMDELQGEIWAIQNQEQLLKVRQQIRDKRLVEFLNLNRSQRVSSSPKMFKTKKLK